MYYPRDTETAFWQAALSLAVMPGKCRDLAAWLIAKCQSRSGLPSQMLYADISRGLLLYLCGLNRWSLWPCALKCQQRHAVIARKCTVCHIIVSLLQLLTAVHCSVSLLLSLFNWAEKNLRLVLHLRHFVFTQHHWILLWSPSFCLQKSVFCIEKIMSISKAYARKRINILTHGKVRP